MSGFPRKKCTPKRASSNRAEHKTVQTRHDKTKQKIQIRKAKVCLHIEYVLAFGEMVIIFAWLQLRGAVSFRHTPDTVWFLRKITESAIKQYIQYL